MTWKQVFIFAGLAALGAPEEDRETAVAVVAKLVEYKNKGVSSNSPAVHLLLATISAPMVASVVKNMDLKHLPNRVPDPDGGDTE